MMTERDRRTILWERPSLQSVSVPDQVAVAGHPLYRGHGAEFPFDGGRKRSQPDQAAPGCDKTA